MEKTLDKIKVLCFDIDGTISCDHNAIKPEIREEFIRLSNLGYKIVLNTGRSKPDVNIFMRNSDFVCDAIVLNGACIVDKDNKSYSEEFIDENSAKTVYDILKKKNLTFVFYYPDKNVEVCGSKTIKELILKDRDKQDDGMDGFFKLFAHEEIVDYKRVLKIETWIVDDDLNNQIKRQLSSLENITCVSSMGFNLEISSKTTNKANKLLEYTNNQGYSKENVMFFGDSENDETVFAEFDNSVYVTNQRHDFDFKTKYQVPSCKDGGVERFLKANF